MNDENVEYIFNSIVLDLFNVLNSVRGRTYGVDDYKRGLLKRLSELGLKNIDAKSFVFPVRQCIDDYFFDIDKERTPSNQGMISNGSFVNGLKKLLYQELGQSFRDLPY